MEMIGSLNSATIMIGNYHLINLNLAVAGQTSRTVACDGCQGYDCSSIHLLCGQPSIFVRLTEPNWLDLGYGVLCDECGGSP